ncbi:MULTISPECIES: SNF2-related protein, partial [Helicobacter]
QIAKKIIDFRDLFNENLKSEKHYLDDEEGNTIILKQKERLRELRSEILHLANVKSFHQNNRNKTDKQGIVLQHNLQNILNLDKLARFSILATETKNDKGNYELSPILKMRAYKPLQKSLANSNEEALQKTINEKGFIDEKTLQDYKPNTPLNEILQDLCEKQLIFYRIDRDPQDDVFYQLAGEFLSGNVKAKYERVQSLIKQKQEGTFIGFPKPHLDLNQTALALKEVFPSYLYYEDIETSFGAKFVPIKYYEDFIKESFFNDPTKAIVKVSFLNGAYSLEKFKILREDFNDGEIVLKEVEASNYDFNEVGLNLEILREDASTMFAKESFIENVLNGKSLEVYHFESHPYDSDKKIKVSESISTKIALEKAEILRETFSNFCFSSKERRETIEKIYNETINVFTHKKFDYGNFLETPHLNKDIVLMAHQKNAAFRAISKNSLLLDHQVGAGKTLAGIAIVMEQIRMSLIKKALILVPNHLSVQWGEEFKRAYPNANILIGDRIDDKKSRKEFLYHAKYGNFDAIIMKHSTFENMSVMESFETQVLNEYKENLENTLRQKRQEELMERLRFRIGSFSEKSDRKFETFLERKIQKLANRLEKRAIGKTYDDEIAFEDLGIDCLMVDEAHYFKNLYIETEQQNVKGLPNTDSAKAMKMYCATQFIHQNKGKLYFLTGTPVSNSISEFFIMQKYLQPNVLGELGLSNFDDWARTFTQIIQSEELDSSGINYKIVSRLSKFINAPELMASYSQNADIITTKDIEKQRGIFVPRQKEGKAINIIAPRSEEIANFIGVENEDGTYNAHSVIWRMENVSEDPSKNNVLACTTDARKAALDFRLIDQNAEDYEDSKVNKMCEKVLFHYKDESYHNGTQLIFCDMGVSKQHSQKIDVYTEFKNEYKSIEDIAKEMNLVLLYDEENEENFYALLKNFDEPLESESNSILKRYSVEDLMALQTEKFDVYADILKKLVQKGIPQEQIAFIGDAKTDIQKQELFMKMNEGAIRILIGSTTKMGTGTNVQKRIIAMHEIDCPWRPCDLEQRMGRGIRQGNMFFEEELQRMLEALKEKDLSLEVKNQILEENIKFNIAHYRYATEQTYDARMFQINEQKLKPLVQLKSLNFNKGQRVFEAIDAEVANVAEMKAVATGNPFILEKHKITSLLKTEERYYEQYKKSILQNERSLEVLKAKKQRLENENEILREFVNNKEFEKENYIIEAFGIKIHKKTINKEEEKEHKALKEAINLNIEKIFKNPSNKEVEVFTANKIKVVLRGKFSELGGDFIYTGIMIDEKNREYVPNNMFFKAQGGCLIFDSIPNLDGLLIKTKNIMSKASSFIHKNSENLKLTISEITQKENFLKNNTLGSYPRKILLDTLKADEKNINVIFELIAQNKKEGIRITLDSKEIQHLLPQYPKLLDERGKFNSQNTQSINISENQESKMSDSTNRAISKVNWSEESQPIQCKTESDKKLKISDEEKYIALIDNKIIQIEEANIEFQTFDKEDELEYRIAILEQNQTNILNAKRNRDIL